MAIRFSVHKTPQPNNRKGKQQTHARAVSYSTQKIKDLKSIRLKNVKSAPCYMPEERKTRLQDNLTYIIHSGFISGYQNRYGDNLKPPTNVYHRMTA